MSDRQLLQLTLPIQSEAQRIQLLHAVGTLVRRLDSPGGRDPTEHFSTRAFADDLVAHMHRAKRNALAGEEG